MNYDPYDYWYMHSEDEEVDSVNVEELNLMNIGEMIHLGLGWELFRLDNESFSLSNYYHDLCDAYAIGLNANEMVETIEDLKIEILLNDGQ